MDFKHSPEVLSFLSKLGHTPDLQAFVPGEDVVKVLKQIRRSLYESETGREARTLLEVHSIANHLVPLLSEMHEEDGEEAGEEFGMVVLEVSKILVLLTLPDSPLAGEHCRELRQALSLPSNSAMSVLVNQIRLALSLDASKRTPEQKLPMDLLFWLVRNLLVDSLSAKTKDVDQFFLLLEREFVLDVCLHFAKHVQRASNREWDVLFLEIFYHVFSTVSSPFDSSSSTVAVAATETMAVETKQVVDALNSQRKFQRSLLGVRHSNFNSGLFQTEDKQFVSQHQRPVTLATTAAELVGVVARKRLVPDTSVIITLPTPNSIFTGREFVLRMAQEFIAESEEEEEEDSAYSSLFASLIQCIQKEDARFQPKDEIHFLWLMRYFPVHPTTSTLWCFTFVINKVYDYLEAKAWVSLELAVQVLFHLLTGVQDKAKLNLVFYELRQRLEIVPKLIRMFDRSVFSLNMLRTLCLLGNFILLTLEDMAIEGAVSKAKQRKAQAAVGKAAAAKNSLPFGLWNAEEMRALEEGVESFQGECSLAVMRQVLKHPTLGTVFEQDKTPNLLLGQWMHIRHQKQVGKTLEQIVQEALDMQNQLEHDAEVAAASVEEQTAASGDPFHETVNAAEITEKKIDFVSELRTYLSNFVFHALSQLVDPGMYDSQAKFLGDTVVHDTVALFFRRLRLFRKGLRAGETLEPLLWHVANFACWRRTLQVFAQAKVKNPLTLVLDSTLRRFFRLAQANSMLFVEVLFWRTKAENLALSGLSFLSATQATVVASKPAFLGEGGEEEDEFGETSREPWSEGNGETATRREEVKSIPATAKQILQSSDAEEEAAVTRPIKAKKERSAKKRSVARRSAPVASEVWDGFQPNLAKLSKAIKPYHRGSMTLLCAELEELEEKEEDEALVLSVDTRGRRDLCRILLLLGMRPPNRNLATKGKDVFACEAYWRCPSSSSYKQLASAVRECLEANKEDEATMDDSSEEEYAWCLSEEEEAQSSGEEEEETVLPTKKRRIVLDSDDDDNNGDEDK
ncbi:hypothetical protein BASA81_001886 [Batrachochytrium salamandrivorans]|nr:hypothetical protein BASA81_001886 [Batrachochytrium salamandrivorans]